MPATRSSRAIVLRTRPYAESDAIVTLLTREAGKLTGLAKGAKNSRRRFANCLQPFTRVHVYFRTRQGASLAFLERCELLHPAANMALPSRFAYGSYLLELVDRLTHEADPIPEIYDLLDSALIQIEAQAATAALLRGFELRLLQALGYGPPIHTCGRCQRPFGRARNGFLDAALGLFLCDRCRPEGPATQEYSSLTLSTLARLKHLPFDQYAQIRLGSRTAQQAASLTGKLLAPHLTRPLKSLDLIAALGSKRD